MVGGFIYWTIPERPTGVDSFLRRVAVGFVAGVLAYALGDVSPFNSQGWSVQGVGELVTLGFLGLTGLATFLPDQLDENVRRLRAGETETSEDPDGASS